MENLKTKLFALLLILFSFQLEAGGGWADKKGTGYFKLSQHVIISDAFFNPDGDIIDITTTGLYSTSLYAEYGLGNNFSANLYAPVFVRNTVNRIQFQDGSVSPGDELNSIGDINVGLKYAFLQQSPVVMAVSLILGIPSGEVSGGRQGVLQTGDGEFNQMIRLEVSKSFYPFYGTVSAALNNRTENFSDEYRLGFEVGYAKNKFSANIKFHTVQSFFNGSDEVTGNGIFSNNTEFVSFTPEVNYTVFNSLGVSANAGFAFSGKNILASPNFGLGIYYLL